MTKQPQTIACTTRIQSVPSSSAYGTKRDVSTARDVSKCQCGAEPRGETLTNETDARINGEKSCHRRCNEREKEGGPSHGDAHQTHPPTNEGGGEAHPYRLGGRRKLREEGEFEKAGGEVSREWTGLSSDRPVGSLLEAGTARMEQRSGRRRNWRESPRRRSR